MPGCKWKPEWQKQFSWAGPVKGKASRVSCSLCLSDLSCDHGIAELKRHEKNSKHSNNVAKRKAEEVRGTRNLLITESLKKAETVSSELKKSKDAALIAEASLSNLIATHNVPRGLIDCLAELLPKIITDSQIVKQMSLHHNKAFYTMTFGTALHVKKRLVRQLQKWPFSINYDESVKGKSSQLELNVSYRNDRNKICRAHLVTVDMVVALTGENISKAVFSALDNFDIPYKDKLVTERTDGCSVMLGIRIGCHQFSKKVVPQLPDMGGCGCHDCCNCLKVGMKAMNKELPILWKALFPCIEKASVKKTLHYKEICEELGLLYKHAPKYLEVRFRYTILLAKWFEENDSSLYCYFKEIADRYVTSEVLPSENEATVIQIYLGDYINTRLSHQFLIEAGEPFLNFIQFFESKSVRAHLLHPKMAVLLSQHFSMFLTQGNRDKMTPRRLLEVDYKDPQMQLSKKDVFVGRRVRNFIKKIGLSCDSPELSAFFLSVTEFYHESSGRLVKYFKTPLTNRFLSDLTVIDPKCRDLMDLSDQRERWSNLGRQLNHVITEEQLGQLLLEELPAFQMLESAKDGVEVDEWWAEVAEVSLGGEKQFPILSNFAFALSTVPNSSSEVERDYSDMEAIFADSRANATGQDLLEAKMTVKSSMKNEAANCLRCKAAKEDRREKILAGEKVAQREKSTHCHCKFFEVDEELLADLRDHQPFKKSKEREAKKAAETVQNIKNMEKMDQKRKEENAKILDREVQGMKKRFLEARVKALKEKKDVAKVKVPKKRVAIEKIEADDRKKRKLAFMMPEMQMLDQEANLTEVVKKVADKLVGNEKEVRVPKVADKVMVNSANLTEGYSKKVAKVSEKVMVDSANLAEGHRKKVAKVADKVMVDLANLNEGPRKKAAKVVDKVNKERVERLVAKVGVDSANLTKGDKKKVGDKVNKVKGTKVVAKVGVKVAAKLID